MSSQIHICRTCLSRVKREDTKNILNDYLSINTLSAKVLIVEAFYEITQQIVDTNEPFTQLICLTCVRKLRQAYLFRVMTLRSYETLCQYPDENDIPFKNLDEQIFYGNRITTKVKDENDVLEEAELQNEPKIEVKHEAESEELEDPVIHVEVKRKKVRPKMKYKKRPKKTQKKTNNDDNEDDKKISKEAMYCDLCPATFTTNRACLIHMKKFHMSSKPYKCWYDGCGRLFRSAGQRHAHENTVHLRVKRFVCSVCGMSFTDNPKLTSHTRIHTNERPYRCDFPGCTAGFKQQYDLTKHKNSIHSKERPWKCEECSATFKLKGGLRAHRRLMHSRENLKKCTDCDKEFLNNAALNNHYVIIHLGQRNHMCQICSKTYAYRKHMLRHMKEAHPLEYNHMIEMGIIVCRMKEQIEPPDIMQEQHLDPGLITINS